MGIDSTLLSMLSELFARNRNYDKICDLFKIPANKRGDSYTGDQIIERINTYLTGYVGRRSVSERENGAAFQDPVIPTLLDPQPQENGKV